MQASQEAVAQQLANKVRRSLLEAWGRDRGKWVQATRDSQQFCWALGAEQPGDEGL